MSLLERPRLLLGTAVAAVVVAALAAAVGSEPECIEVPGARPCVELISLDDRREAPPDAMPIVGGDGATLGLEDLRGQVVVLNFWASWCAPCRVEQPDLNEAYEELSGPDVTFLGVAIQDSEANARAHEREFAMPYPSLLDPSNVYASKFTGVSPRAIPTTLIIDREGRVAVRLLGLTTRAEIAALVPIVAGE